MKSAVWALALAASAEARSIRRQSGPVDPSTVKDCTYYTTYGDSSVSAQGTTCDSIASYWGITTKQFITYNPSVGSDCSHLIKGHSYCVEENYGKPPTTTAGSSPTTSTPTSTASAKPSPTQDGLASNCNNFYKVQSGDYCQKIVDSYGTFGVSDFYTWNPAVGNDCSHLFVDYYVCVGVPGTPTAKPTTASATPSPTNGPQPQQSGITKDCKNFYQVQSGDYCQKIVDSFGTFTVNQFYSWNPAVGNDCSHLFVGYYVCVGVSGTPTTKPTTTPSATPTGNGPSPTQSGIRSDCQKYYQAVSGDSCYNIQQKFGTFSVSDFEGWNPAVGSDCSHLFVGYYYCVAVPGTPTTPTSSAPSPTGHGPQPQQPGVTSNCRTYYQVQSGDYCDLIEQRNNISADQFFSWNSGLKRDCSNLFGGYYVCVAA